MTNALTSAGIALVKQFEGFRSQPYLDPAGINTVGFGHVVLPGESFDTITEDQATAMLASDLERFGGYVLHHITVPLNDNQYSALTSLTFNEGTAPLVGTLGKLLNQYCYEAAANEFDRWIYSAGQVLEGLVQRRAAEKALFLEQPSTNT